MNEILNAHPAPWRYVTVGGDVTVLDANGRPVSLFTMLDFTCAVTRSLARSAAKQAEDTKP